jgi:phytoene synthase
MNLNYCLEHIAPKGSDNHYALLKLPHETKQKISAVLHLFDTIFSIPFTVSDEEIAKVKLAWWKGEIDNTQQGKPTHPITQIFSHFKLDLSPSLSLIHELDTLFGYCRFDNIEDLMVFIINTFGQSETAIARLMGEDIETHREAILQAATLLALTYFVRHLRQHSKRSFFFLPESELTQCNVSHKNILDFTTTDNIKQLLSLQHDKVMKADSFKQCRPTFLRCKLAKQWWKAVKSERYQVLEKQVLIPALRKFFLVLLS